MNQKLRVLLELQSNSYTRYLKNYYKALIEFKTIYFLTNERKIKFVLAVETKQLHNVFENSTWDF